ncbi:MAG: hypothetical protein AAFU83_04475 [Bacteroidota bacterium]
MKKNRLTTAEQIRRAGIKEGIEQGIKLGIERVREEGREKSREEIVKHMLRANVPEAEISFLTGLENSKIAEIAAKADQ